MSGSAVAAGPPRRSAAKRKFVSLGGEDRVEWETEPTVGSGEQIIVDIGESDEPEGPAQFGKRTQSISVP